MYFLRVYYTLVTFGGWQRLLWVFADIFDLFASPGKSMSVELFVTVKYTHSLSFIILTTNFESSSYFK